MFPEVHIEKIIKLYEKHFSKTITKEIAIQQLVKLRTLTKYALKAAPITSNQ